MILAAVVLASYLLGGICAGYYLVRWSRGLDVRRTGSGSAGARNVGRLLGAPGFFATLALDAAKGAVAVLGAGRVATGPWPPALALLAVVLGHVFPAQLQGRGGKGVATALGGLLASALAAPRAPIVDLATLTLLGGLLLWAHRDNLAGRRRAALPPEGR